MVNWRPDVQMPEAVGDFLLTSQHLDRGRFWFDLRFWRFGFIAAWIYRFGPGLRHSTVVAGMCGRSVFHRLPCRGLGPQFLGLLWGYRSLKRWDLIEGSKSLKTCPEKMYPHLPLFCVLPDLCGVSSFCLQCSPSLPGDGSDF